MGSFTDLLSGRAPAAPPRLDDVLSRRDDLGHEFTVRMARTQEPVDVDAHVDASQAAVPAVAGFEAATPAGALRIEVNQARVRHAADAALALMRADDLLWALQLWTGWALDWRWVETASSTDHSPSVRPEPVEGPQPPCPHPATHLCMPWQLPADTDATYPPTAASSATTQAGDTAAHGWLHLPWPLLRALPAPEGLLTHCLPWPDIDAVLSVATLQLDPQELEQLEPGGALLLSPSFIRPWLGRLRAGAEPALAGVPVDLSCVTSPRLASAAAELLPPAAAQPAHIACEMRLALPGPLPAATLAGWHAGRPLATQQQATLWRTTSLRGPAACLAYGRLMPWGDGWALSLDMLCDAAVLATLDR